MLVIPATQVRLGGLWVQGHPGQKVSETLISISKAGMVMHTCDLSYTGGSQSEAGPGQKCKTLPKKKSRG
jgi:hypothetical protein